MLKTRDVRFTPEDGYRGVLVGCPLCAKRRQSALQQLFDHLVGDGKKVTGDF
jgi:hypothetical protein